jgi:tRNA threonylcarbamoyl adenosine modification protein YeaZ
MNVLAVDGALGAFSAAIACGDRIVASRCEPGNIALERGLALVEAVRCDARLQPSEIDRLAVGTGPGGFTGLRIAITYAKSLAAAWSRPLVSISSFDLLEFGSNYDPVLAVVVGRPGVISARYRHGRRSERASGRIDEVLDRLSPFVLRQAQDDKAQGDTNQLSVIGAPKDVLHALAERGIIVHPIDPVVTPAAAAAALAAGSRAPAKSLHEVRADYGELPAVTMPKR